MLLAMILIIPAFVFIGINGYSRLNPDANAIAKVDGKGIQPEEFDGQKREFIERERRLTRQSFSRLLPDELCLLRCLIITCR